MLDQIIALNLPKELIVTLIAMTPIFELRGALPVAINLFGFSWPYALIISITGNMLPVPFLLLFWDGLSRFLGRISYFRRPLKWLFDRTQRHSAEIGKYKFIGLLVFVAIPLPFTGAWTASLVAIVLGMKFWPSFLSILGGVVVAGVIVTSLSLLGWWGAGIAIAGTVAILVWSLRRNNRHSQESIFPPDKIKP